MARSSASRAARREPARQAYPARHVLCVVAALVAAGCTGGSDNPPAQATGTFALPAAGEVACLEHQERTPGTAYTAGSGGDTAAILALLRYWATHGEKPYCDGQPPTAVDLRWRDLVAELGARRPPDVSGTPAADEPTSPGTGPDAPEST